MSLASTASRLTLLMLVRRGTVFATGARSHFYNSGRRAAAISTC